MDGLALLCNLFADGPVTLRRLRAAHLASLAEVERVEPESLAECLHASVPQARSFAEEARRLRQRLSEESPRLAAARPAAVEAPPSPSAIARRPAVSPVAGPSAAPSPAPPLPPLADESADDTLRPGLFPGLDEPLCARLHQHQVRTVQALGEFAGLALARRTGIPYSTLLELSRAARRHASARGRSPDTAPVPREVPLAQVELTPFLPRPKRAPSEVELASDDAFTLPLVEPESAGPFG